MNSGPDWVGLEPDYNHFLIFEFDPFYKSCQKNKPESKDVCKRQLNQAS